MVKYLTEDIMMKILKKNNLSDFQKECIELFNEWMPKHQINTLPRIQFLMAIILGETSFNAREENFRYSREQVVSWWKGRFSANENIDDYLVKGKPDYVKAASKLANKVYGHPASTLGNELMTPTNDNNKNYEESDGWLYRGSGFIQLTGKGNFKKYYDGNPEDVRRAIGAVRAACKYAQERKNLMVKNGLTILGYADQDTPTSFIEACRCVGHCADKDNYSKKRNWLKLCKQYITSSSTGLPPSSTSYSDREVYLSNEVDSHGLNSIIPVGSNVFLEAIRKKLR